MGIFSFFEKKNRKRKGNEIREKIKISEEERLLIDLRTAIKSFHPLMVLSDLSLATDTYLRIQKAIYLLERVRYRIILIENIAKNLVKNSLKPANYRQASLPSDLKKAHENLKVAETQMKELIIYLKRRIIYINDFHLSIKGQRDRSQSYKIIHEAVRDVDKRVSYLGTLEKDVMYLIDLEKKAQEQS